MSKKVKDFDKRHIAREIRQWAQCAADPDLASRMLREAARLDPRKLAPGTALEQRVTEVLHQHGWIRSGDWEQPDVRDVVRKIISVVKKSDYDDAQLP